MFDPRQHPLVREIHRLRSRLLELGQAASASLDDCCGDVPHSDHQKLADYIMQQVQDELDRNPTPYDRYIEDLARLYEAVVQALTDQAMRRTRVQVTAGDDNSLDVVVGRAEKGTSNGE